MPDNPLSRATSVDGIRERLSLFSTDEALQRGLAVEVRADDVFIATYPKCGTTWVQQIVHGLRTRGSMTFEEISQVVPWLERAFDIGIDLAAPQVASPRAFKTHLDWTRVPRGGRYIHVTREPAAAAISMYRFFEGWFFEPGSVDIDTFVAEFFLSGSKSGRFWDHLCTWWPQRERADVLFLCYEDMLADPVSSVRKMAALAGIGLDDELLDIVVRQSTREFMAARSSQFDDHVLRGIRDPIMQLPPGGDSAKVHAAAAGQAYELSRASLAALDARWAADVAPVTGLASYRALRDALRA